MDDMVLENILAVLVIVLIVLLIDAWIALGISRKNDSPKDPKTGKFVSKKKK